MSKNKKNDRISGKIIDGKFVPDKDDEQEELKEKKEKPERTFFQKFGDGLAELVSDLKLGIKKHGKDLAIGAGIGAVGTLGAVIAIGVHETHKEEAEQEAIQQTVCIPAPVVPEQTNELEDNFPEEEEEEVELIETTEEVVDMVDSME